MDRALQDRLDALLHRPELPAAVDEDHLLRGGEDLERDLEGAVASADDDHAFAFELVAVPDAVLDALPLEFGLAGDVEPLRFEQPHAHREQAGPRLVRVAIAGSDLVTCGDPFVIQDLLGPK